MSAAPSPGEPSMGRTRHDGQVDTVMPPMLLHTLAPGLLHPMRLTTHHFSFDYVMQAHDVSGGGRWNRRSMQSARAIAARSQAARRCG